MQSKQHTVTLMGQFRWKCSLRLKVGYKWSGQLCQALRNSPQDAVQPVKVPACG